MTVGYNKYMIVIVVAMNLSYVEIDFLFIDIDLRTSYCTLSFNPCNFRTNLISYGFAIDFMTSNCSFTFSSVILTTGLPLIVCRISPFKSPTSAACPAELVIFLILATYFWSSVPLNAWVDTRVLFFFFDI